MSSADYYSLIRTQPHDLTTSIWDPASPFSQTIEKLDVIYQNLPERYRLTDANIPALQEQRILGGVLFFHFLMHAVVSDMTRPSLPGFNFPLAGAFWTAPPDFRSQCQERCRLHAVHNTDLVRKGLSCGRSVFDDVFPVDAALEAAKIQIIYAAAVNQGPEIIQQTRENVTTTLEFFSLSNRGKDGPGQYVRA